MLDNFYNPNNLEQPEGPPYRGKQNRKLTQALFWEYYKASPGRAAWLPVFCLKHDWDTRRLPLIEVYGTFLATDDPTGYRWAMEYIKDYDVYKKLLNYDWFKSVIDEVTEEILRRKKSKAFARIEQVLEEGSDNQALAAARYILEEGWKKSESRRGRPSKAEVEGERRRIAKLSKDEEADLARIGLVVDNTKGTNHG